MAVAAARKPAVVLLVVDDHGVRAVSAELMREYGHVVVEAGRGGATLDILQHKPKVGLAVIDFALPA